MHLLDRQIDNLPQQGEIVYAVLDWGLGHATRSSVVIRRLLDRGRSVTIASDGMALDYLRTAFPACKIISLRSYDISYSRWAALLPLHLGLQIPKVLRAIRAEHNLLAEYIRRHEVAAIISDNRYGCYTDMIPSYLLTHQLQLLVPGMSGWIANKVLTRWLGRFDEVWVPDDPAARLSGQLSNHPSIETRYTGVLSALEVVAEQRAEPIVIALSGPEPQRTVLEDVLCEALATHSDQIVLIRGSRQARRATYPPQWQIYDLVDAQQMSVLLAQARLVICRSGYSTIMDLHHLDKRAILIPTPRQPEQEYLAEWLAAERPHQYTVLHQEGLDVGQLVSKLTR